MRPSLPLVLLLAALAALLFSTAFAAAVAPVVRHHEPATISVTATTTATTTTTMFVLLVTITVTVAPPATPTSPDVGLVPPSDEEATPSWGSWFQKFLPSAMAPTPLQLAGWTLELLGAIFVICKLLPGFWGWLEKKGVTGCASRR
ncbi:hypothetical protein B0T16DRAFT_442460 [Cercophora newfieldiana]|uniref:Uncharacterized protein n=1 Tax=Cercophora newfieldiana TaxID=92897 RepID=A0AA39YTI4_9PEZI|nr:hypothetical protein B0T16DRAFT_442460 [Cercophora newfieldiana]